MYLGDQDSSGKEWEARVEKKGKEGRVSISSTRGAILWRLSGDEREKEGRNRFPSKSRERIGLEKKPEEKKRFLILFRESWNFEQEENSGSISQKKKRKKSAHLSSEKGGYSATFTEPRQKRNGKMREKRGKGETTILPRRRKNPECNSHQDSARAD